MGGLRTLSRFLDDHEIRRLLRLFA
jgi:hypothetical protein